MFMRRAVVCHPPATDSMRELAGQTLSRAAGATLIAGNAVDLLIDGRENFDAWLAAIQSSRDVILFENYIFRDDELARTFLDALIERANAGVRVCVIRDWMGCLGQSTMRFWQPLIAAGGEVRTYNPPQLTSPLGWLSRDHRKLLVVDHAIGFVSGVCLSAKWLGDEKTAPWRDTGVAIRGPAIAHIVEAFSDTWALLGSPLDAEAGSLSDPIATAGLIDMRVIATVPSAAGLYRLDQMIAAMAREHLWLTDAYFVGVAPYVQSLSAAARDGVDVRLLVPGSSDIPAVGSVSRAGYRALLEAGVRVFEWNGSMLHAKTAVADGRWARVGSSNLNIASWMGNCEIDVSIENPGFARRMQEQYEADLENATEIVLQHGTHVKRRTRRSARKKTRSGGSSGRATAGALRLANTMSAAITNRRVLGRAENGVLLAGATILAILGLFAFIWPRLLAWPIAALATWSSVSLLMRYVGTRNNTPRSDSTRSRPRPER